MERKLSRPIPSCYVLAPSLSSDSPPGRLVNRVAWTEPFREHPPSQTHRLPHTF